MGNDDIVRVTRTLQYTGSRSWVESTMLLNTVDRIGAKFPLGDGREVRETYRNLEVLEERPRPRYVQVSYVRGENLGSDRWDYIDECDPPLQVGDRVVAPRINWRHEIGIVVGIGRGKLDWNGPWSILTHRVGS